MKNNKFNLDERFTFITSDFNFLEKEKISINKLELTKAINVSTQSDEIGYAMIPKSYDKKKRLKDEDDTVKEMESWLKNQQDRLEAELKKMYPELI
jgi:hypothetical protein